MGLPPSLPPSLLRLLLDLNAECRVQTDSLGNLGGLPEVRRVSQGNSCGQLRGVDMALNALVHLAKGGLDKDGHMLVLARAVSNLSLPSRCLR